MYVQQKPADSLPDERSPVFVQCLDAVHQLLLQYPLRFEFTSELLVFIADHVHSGGHVNLCVVSDFHFIFTFLVILYCT